MGSVARLTNKRTGRNVFAGPAHLPLVVDDSADTWSHDLDRFGVGGQAFRCERVEEGPLRAGLHAYAHAGLSTITSTYLRRSDLPGRSRRAVVPNVALTWDDGEQRLG